jgi:O-antigen/teichoic acid export membrane protein
MLRPERYETRPRDYLDTKHLQQDLKNKSVKGAGYSLISQVLSVGIQTVGTIILARMLTPKDFGLITMVTAFSMFLKNYGYNGIREAVIQRDDLTHEQLSKLFWVYMAIMVGLTAAFMAASPLIALFYHQAPLVKISLVMALMILFAGLSTCHTALLSRNMKFQAISSIQVVAAFLGTAAAVFMALKGLSYWALVARLVLVEIVTALLVWLSCGWRPGMPEKRVRIGHLMRFSFSTYVIYLIEYVRKTMDKVLVGKVLGGTSLGHYDRAYQFSALLPNQLTASLSGVGVASLSRLRDNQERYRDSFAKTLSIISFIGFPGSVFLTIVGKDLIVFVLGKQWAEAGIIFSALGPAVGLVVVYNSIYWLHFSLGRADRLLKWTLFTLFASAGFYALGILFGLVGVAVAYSVFFYIVLIPALCYAGQPLSLKPRFFISILWKYWLGSFLTGGFYLALAFLLGPTARLYGRMGLFLRIGLGSVVYLSAYLTLIIVLFKGSEPLRLLRSVAREFVSKSAKRE